VKRILGALLVPIVCGLGCTIYLTPLTPEARKVRVVEWSSASPNEDEVNAVMDCEPIGLPEKSSDRNHLLNLAAERRANVLLLRVLREHTAMGMQTYGPDFDASFYRCPDPAAPIAPTATRIAYRGSEARGGRSLPR
jgi:hypothetical protein